MLFKSEGKNSITDIISDQNEVCSLQRHIQLQRQWRLA